MSGGQGRRPDALGVVQRIEVSLRAGGFKVGRDSVAGRQVLIGRRSELRLRRAGSRLHVFMLVGVFKSDASPEHLDRFLDEAAEYATTIKAGLASATCAIAVAVVDSAAAVGDWATAPPPRHRACPSLPVLVDLERGRIVFPDRPPTGTVSTAHLGQLVRTHVGPSVGRS